MSPKVVVIGIGFSSRLGMIRALGQIGVEIEVIILCHGRFKPVDCYSKYVSRYFYVKGNNGSKVLDILSNHCIDKTRKTLLIPINDFAAKIIDQHIDLLKEHFMFPHIHMTQGAVSEWMNKELQKNLAKAVGLNVADAINVEIKNGQYQLPKNTKYPCFTKTRAYVGGYKGTLHRCDDEQTLRKVLDSLSNKYRQITIMVEDYKEIEKEYAVVGFSDGKEVIIPGVLEILVMAQGDDKGVACQGKVMPNTGFEALVEKFKRLMLELGFVGLFDIDFYLSEGQFYFGEINLRIGGSASAVLKMGVNLPAMMVKSFMGESYDDMNKVITSSAVYANERICSDNWYQGHISKQEMFGLLQGADISFVKDEQDRAPERRFGWELRMMGIKRFIKNCLNKR